MCETRCGHLPPHCPPGPGDGSSCRGTPLHPTVRPARIPRPVGSVPGLLPTRPCERVYGIGRARRIRLPQPPGRRRRRPLARRGPAAVRPLREVVPPLLRSRIRHPRPSRGRESDSPASERRPRLFARAVSFPGGSFRRARFRASGQGIEGFFLAQGPSLLRFGLGCTSETFSRPWPLYGLYSGSPTRTVIQLHRSIDFA